MIPKIAAGRIVPLHQVSHKLQKQRSVVARFCKPYDYAKDPLGEEIPLYNQEEVLATFGIYESVNYKPNPEAIAALAPLRHPKFVNRYLILGRMPEDLRFYMPRLTERQNHLDLVTSRPKLEDDLNAISVRLMELRQTLSCGFLNRAKYNNIKDQLARGQEAYALMRWFLVNSESNQDNPSLPLVVKIDIKTLGEDRARGIKVPVFKKEKT